MVEGMLDIKVKILIEQWLCHLDFLFHVNLEKNKLKTSINYKDMDSKNFKDYHEELHFKSHLLSLTVSLYKIADIINLPLFLLLSTQ